MGRCCGNKVNRATLVPAAAISDRTPRAFPHFPYLQRLLTLVNGQITISTLLGRSSEIATFSKVGALCSDVGFAARRQLCEVRTNVLVTCSDQIGEKSMQIRRISVIRGLSRTSKGILFELIDHG